MEGNEDQIRDILTADIFKWRCFEFEYPTAKFYQFGEWVTHRRENLKELDIAINLQRILPCEDAQTAAARLSETMGREPHHFIAHLERLVEKGFIEIHSQQIRAREPLLSRWIEKNIYDALIQIDTFHGFLFRYLDVFLQRIVEAPHQRYALWGINAFTAHITRYLLKNGKDVAFYIDLNAAEYEQDGLMRPVYTFNEILESTELKEQMDAVVICSRGHADEIGKLVDAAGISHFPVFHRPVERYYVSKNNMTPYGVVGNCIPKAGTHLLIKTLTNLFLNHVSMKHIEFKSEKGAFSNYIRECITSIQPGEYYAMHIQWMPGLHELFRTSNLKMVLIMRDPRDIGVSYVEYFSNAAIEGTLFSLYKRQFNNFDQRLMAFIMGMPPEIVEMGLQMYRDEHPQKRFTGWIFDRNRDLKVPDNHELHTGMISTDVTGYMNLFLPWLQHEYVCAVKYEDLVGIRGGGTAERQWRAIKRIGEHLELALSDEEIQNIAERLFDKNAPTFRKGAIGDWKNRFTPEHIKAFKKVAGQLLIDLGYEKDDDW